MIRYFHVCTSGGLVDAASLLAEEHVGVGVQRDRADGPREALRVNLPLFILIFSVQRT